MGTQRLTAECSLDCISQAYPTATFSGHVEPVFTNGYVLILPPLASGPHELHFTHAYQTFTMEVTYNLMVD